MNFSERHPFPCNQRIAIPVSPIVSWAVICLLSAIWSGCLFHCQGAATPLVSIQPAPLVHFPGGNRKPEQAHGETDCNSPLHWAGGSLYLFNSAGHPWRSSGPDLFHLTNSYERCAYNNQVNGGRWIEATWLQEPVLYGWYHLEPGGLCPGTRLTAPKIGAVRSADHGATWEDLGIVIEAPPNTLNCETKNYYFAGGTGDFSVMLQAEYLYFFFSTYTGGVSEQGVAMARMKWPDRDQPPGKAWKWREGSWNEPGLGGHATPIFSGTKDWHQQDANAFWGPSLHWNSHLKRFVMLLNRARDANWSQEGIYISFNNDLANPQQWSSPQKIMGDLRKDDWYPQVVGLNSKNKETDKLAGERARLFIRGRSEWEIHFSTGK